MKLNVESLTVFEKNDDAGNQYGTINRGIEHNNTNNNTTINRMVQIITE